MISALRLREYAHELQFAKRNEKRGYLPQLLEIARLRFGPNKLGVSEYFFFRLFEDVLSLEQKKEFVGWRKEQEIDKVLNQNDWHAIANDKLLFYTVMKGLDLPHPAVKAVYLDRRRSFLGAHLLSNIEDIKKYLRRKENYPLFLKPVEATFGRGAISALDYDEDSDEIITGGGDPQTVDAVLQTIAANATNGYIFSEMLKSHPEIERLCGPRLSSVRLIALVERGVPRLFRGVWKIPTGKNVTDNFMHGRTGNYVGAVNVEDGYIERVVTGTGTSLSIKSHHPDTKMKLGGHCLPYWERVVRLCLDGASALPGLCIQHWDIAFCPDGPVVLELNVEGSLDLHQIASGRGVYDKALEDVILSRAKRKCS